MSSPVLPAYELTTHKPKKKLVHNPNTPITIDLHDHNSNPSKFATKSTQKSTIITPKKKKKPKCKKPPLITRTQLDHHRCSNEHNINPS